MDQLIASLPLPVLLLLLLFSLVMVVKAADWFVSGAAALSQRFGISAFVIGLTVVAMGTSAPELAINVIAALHGATDLSIGNIIGSNIADILLGLGLAALITPLTLHSQTVWKEIPFSLLGVLLILLLGSDRFIDAAPANILSRSDGLVLLAFFVIFMVYTFGLQKTRPTEAEAITPHTPAIALGLVLAGVVGLVLFGKGTVAAATAIAHTLGFSQNLVGLTLVAAGTSLPEIVTAMTAARKGHVDLVVGGIVGTIIFNIFFALGATAVAAPLPFSFENVADASFLAAVSVVFFVFMFIGHRHTLTKKQGAAFVLLYLGYLIFILWRG